MALPLPIGKKIHIYRRVVSGDYEMPSMEAGEDHYLLGFIFKGDRLIITPSLSSELHKGNVSCIPPFLYHRALSLSKTENESILIKFAPSFLEPLNRKLGEGFIDDLYKNIVKSFSKEDEEYIFSRSEKMLEVYENNSYDEFLELRLQSMLIELILEIAAKDKKDVNSYIHKGSLSKPMLEAVYYIEKNYKKPLKMEEISRVTGYSEAYFSRLFKNSLNISFSDYLLNVRLKHVCQDLISTNNSIMEIAYENGFIYPGNMTEAFKRKFNMTPLKYRSNSLKGQTSLKGLKEEKTEKN